MHRFHPDLPPSYVWGFDGRVPGPTILAQYGKPVLVRMRNDLPATHTGFGINEVTVHLHNGHTPYESDGFASDYYGPGLWKDMHYPNVLAGYDAFPPKGDPREAMHTLWYHDHRHTFTSPNTYRGLAAMYFLYDDVDTGNETDSRSSALRLPAPYGVHDIPLVLSDKLFCPDGQLFANNNPGGVPAGDKFCVNGVIQPYFRVKRRKYRFRVLATGPARIWNLRLSNNAPLKVIATDGNLLESPIDVQNLTVNVAERYDFVIDFSQAQPGELIYLVNNAAQFVSNAPEPDPVPGIPIGNVLMRFDVVGGTVSDPSRVPSRLCTYPTLNLNEVVQTRTLDFDLVNGVFLINGQVFDENTPLFSVKKGTAERWILRNVLPAAGWTHPVHIHFEEFRVLTRNGAAPPPLETGRKDVIVLPGGNTIELFMRFRDFKGKYMVHCHNMNHEDNFMLARWDIVD
jgi:FtsP/CotA-like multicopper oxidase with cupredoxin domain